jgi:hypothetical protein
VAIPIFILIARSRIKKKTRTQIFAGVAMYLLFIVMLNIPFENLFYTFPTPESIFGYMLDTENKTIDAVIEGKNSAVILYTGNGRGSSFEMRKNNDGYTLLPYTVRPLFVKTSIISSPTSAVQLSNIIGTDDFYIDIWDFGFNDNLPVFDSYGTKFTCIVRQYQSISNAKTYYAYIHNLNDDYELTIGDSTYTRSDFKSFFGSVGDIVKEHMRNE